MAKKKQADTTPIDDEELAAPAVTTPADAPPADPSPAEMMALAALPYPPPPPTVWPWPEHTERRPVLIEFNDHDRALIGNTMGEVIEEREALKERKKNSNSAYQAQIDATDETLARHAASLRAGGEHRDTACRWLFEVSGKDDTGAWIPNQQYKTLIVIETGAVIETRQITEEDRQATLSLDTELTVEECEVKLQSFGYELVCDENPAEGETPFFIRPITETPGEDSEEGITGDDRLTAARNAVKVLEQRAADALTAEEQRLEAIREEGCQCRRDRGANSRAKCPYAAGTKEREYWKAGHDAESDRIEREAAASAAELAAAV